MQRSRDTARSEERPLAACFEEIERGCSDTSAFTPGQVAELIREGGDATD